MRPLVFAGGGTGGHLYPALAIKEALEARAGPTPCLFLCSERAIDASILSREGVEHRPIKARPIAANPKAVMRLTLGWGGAVRASREAIRDVASRHGQPIVVAMGGYVAAPAAVAARAEKVPVVLVNLDAVPGKANRWIARRADRVMTAAPVERGGWEQIPPIVRSAAMASGDAPTCRATFGLDPDRSTLLVTGASLGATSINVFMSAFAERHADLLGPEWQVIHQCGDKDVDDVRAAYERSGVRAVVQAFIDPMGPAWGAADLAVSRAGAGSVAEAWANCLPTIFLPYPFHKDQHQRRNAEVLARAGGAVIMPDRIQGQANLEGEAGDALVSLLQDVVARREMREALKGLGPTDGARRVTKALQDL